MTEVPLSGLRALPRLTGRRWGELTPDRCPDLRNLSGRTTEPVEPRHQRGVQGSAGTATRREPGSAAAARSAALRLAPGLQHRFGHFLHE